MKHVLLTGGVVALLPIQLDIIMHTHKDISWVTRVRFGNGFMLPVTSAGHPARSTGLITLKIGQSTKIEDNVELYGLRTRSVSGGHARRIPHTMVCRIVSTNRQVPGHIIMKVSE